MALEVATYISDLTVTNPVAGDPVSQADDHIRLLKSTVKATFPNVSGAVTPTHTELNYLVGVTSAIQTQISAKVATTLFPNVSGAANPTHTELNYVVGVTSAIQTQLAAKVPTTFFPNVSGAANPTQTELNYVVGVTSLIQSQIDHATLTRASSTTAATKATIDFTSIPTWVKRVTVSFYGLKSAGAASSLLTPLLQIGSASGGIETSGYVGSGSDFGTTWGQTAGFAMCGSFGSSNTIYGRWQLENVTGNLWVCAAVGAFASGPTLGAGGKTTSDVLDRVRITTVNGTELYTGGTVNISYE